MYKKTVERKGKYKKKWALDAEDWVTVIIMIFVLIAVLFGMILR